MIFTLQAYGKILKYALLRVKESKPPNSFRIMTDYLIDVMIQVSIIDRDTGKGHLRSCEVIS